VRVEKNIAVLFHLYFMTKNSYPTMYFNRKNVVESFPPFSLDWMKVQRNWRMRYIWTQSFEKVIRCIKMSRFVMKNARFLFCS
jgi:hypothetical protein